MERISLIPAKPQEFGGGGDSYVEDGSWSDGDRKEAEGVTPLWTVFQLCNYFWRYFANFGISARFRGKKAKLGAETPEKILAVTMQLNQSRLLDLFAQTLCRSPLTDRLRICSRLTPRLAQKSTAQALSFQLHGYGLTQGLQASAESGRLLGGPKKYLNA